MLKVFLVFIIMIIICLYFMNKSNNKKINYKELFNKLNFDFVINYDYNNSKIIGTGFSDFF